MRPVGVRQPALLVCGALCVLPLAACESSQTKSARLERAAASTPDEAGLTITTPSASVKALKTTVLPGKDGVAAVAVELESSSKAPEFGIPILIKVTDAEGTEVFTNATPGLQPSLTALASLAPGASAVWVNDQIPYAGQTGLRATATIGTGSATAPTTPVSFSATAPTLEEDPVSGLAAKGFVRHDADTEQQRVLVTIVGRKGRTIVAAGRAIVERVKPGRRARYTAFLAGKPKGATFTATASESMERGAALAPEATATPSP